MEELFYDLPEALENNYNLVFKINFKPNSSKPVLPDTSSGKGSSSDEILKDQSLKGLINKFCKTFNVRILI